MKNKKRITLIALVLLVATALTIAVCAEAPTMTGLTRPYSWSTSTGIYYMKGEAVQITTAYTGGTPTSGQIYWMGYTPYLTTLSISSGYQGVTGTFTPVDGVRVDSNGNPIGVYDDHYPGVYNGQQLYDSPGNIKVELSNDDGTTYREKAGYVTVGYLSNYLEYDPSFSYTDELTNDFYAVATPIPISSLSGTYNCLSYAIDDYTQWN